jgi:hypothetical protein
MKDMETHIIQCQIKKSQNQYNPMPPKMAVPKNAKEAKKKAAKGHILIKGKSPAKPKPLSDEEYAK